MISDFVFNSHPKFDKEMEKFFKKCPSMKNDFERFKIALCVSIKNNDYNVPIDNKKFFKIEGLSKKVYLPAFVVKMFYCEKMNRGSNSGFRITFVYDKSKKPYIFQRYILKEIKM